jgi:Bacterial regulatory proteins, tetR family
MTNRRPPQISWQKQPKQVRSAELVVTILEAAIQVLEKEGAYRFTTARAAKKAAGGVGSVYQYFPKGSDPLPARERGMEADNRVTARHSSEHPETIP